MAAVLDDARAFRGGALVVRGLQGVGKSALLTDSVQRATGMQVLRTRGIESESPLPFAALHRLLRPVLRLVDRLPDPQARALRAAFGETEGDGGDRFRVFLAALSVLAEAAEESPVLCVVDDAHWLDNASAEALLFVARRLQAERVAMLFGARDGDLRRFDSGDLPGVVVSGIDPAAASDLLTTRAGVPVPADVRDRLMAGTGGNPLALVELARTLPISQLTGAEPLPATLPLTEGVERAFLDRCRRLPESAQALLLVIAADDSGRVRTVRQAAAKLGAGEDELDVVERSGLLTIRDGWVELRHPLVRSAVYGGATSYQRRRAHAALAGVLVGPQDADRRAWHRAAAADEPDDEVVAELDAAAERAHRRGGLEAAAAAWERAAELSTDGEARAQRLYSAARDAWLAGQPARAAVLADTAAHAGTDPGLRADAARLRARIEWNTGSVSLAHRMILRAAQEVVPLDVDRAREMAMFAAAVAAFGGRSGVDIDPVTFAAADSAATLRTRCFADLLLGLDAVAAGDFGRAAPRLRAAFTMTAVLDDADQDLLPNLGIAALHLGDDDASLRYHEMILTRARDTGAMVMVLYALTRRGFTEVGTGRWARADADAAEALELANGMGRPGLTGLPLAWLALLAGFRGDSAFTARLAEVELVTKGHQMGILAGVISDLIHWAKGLGSAGDPAAALHHLERISHGLVRRMAAVDRIEAAVRADRVELARDWVAEVQDFALATGTAWAAAAAQHGLALLTDDRTAESQFERALAEHARSPRVFDRARTELAFGEFLRRCRRRVDARTHLAAALQTFQDLGATPWADRAAAELRASGQTARRRDPATTPELTPQELQVARLVSQGLPNREVAARLFLSPRTVDYHLRNVFAKAGISSRAELARMSLSA